MKTILSLKNTKNPLAKKRQVMRIYRAKMAKEEEEFKLNINVWAKPKGCEKSIFLKGHLEPQTSKSSKVVKVKKVVEVLDSIST